MDITEANETLHLGESIRQWLPWEMEYLGEGRHRRAYKVLGAGEPFVLKFPTGSNGMVDNLKEAAIWEKHGRTDGNFWYAACEVLIICGLPILKMEWVTHFASEEGKAYRKEKHPRLPEWTDWIDCIQVGYTKDGTLVAFDYA